MTQEEVIRMANKAELCQSIWIDSPDENLASVIRFAKLVAAKEREAILQMFEHAPTLVDFAKNDQGGCLICGFTPELAIKSIRARGEA